MVNRKESLDTIKRKMFSICIPVYNNEKNLIITIPYIIEHLYLFDKYDIEIIIVNDGSTDNSYEVMKKYKEIYPNIIHIAKLTRNFGQGACSHACYDLSHGDVVGIISADGQDPLELFVEMLKEWEKGYKIVIATREHRDEYGIRVAFSKLFHKIMHGLINKRYPIGGFDFLIMDREVLRKYLQIDQVDSMGQFKLLWLGYEYKILYYTRGRRNSGKSGYNITKRVGLAWNTLIYNTILPIHILLILGLLVTLISIVVLIMVGCFAIFDVIHPSDLFYIICLLLVASGINLTAIGVVGEYLWNQFQFIKALPRYVIDENR